tara:strand:+ start:162 stop:389 length:228 start_codon:yes stop_codon:yes gene_type:complete
VILFLILLCSLALADEDTIPTLPPPPQPVEEPDMCVGCDVENEPKSDPPQLTVEILIDPLTGNIQYIIKGITIDQ